MDKICTFPCSFFMSNSTETNTIKSLVNRLSAKIQVIGVQLEQYKWPCFTTPGPTEPKNNKCAVGNTKCESTELQKILKEGCVQEVTAKPQVVNSLSVAGNTQNQRLVLDARHVNPHLFGYKHKYEDASTWR